MPNYRSYQTLMTCRFCKGHSYDHTDFVKYGVRHYAHHRCYLESGKPLSCLHDWQIMQFPALLLSEMGLLEVAEAAAKRLDHAELCATRSGGYIAGRCNCN